METGELSRQKTILIFKPLTELREVMMVDMRSRAEMKSPAEKLEDILC